MSRPKCDMNALPTVARETLDEAMAGGCAIKDCKSNHHKEPLFLHSRCHIGADLQVSYSDGKLAVFCGECSRPIIKVEVK